MSVTALQLVNRARRKLKWEDVSSFSSSDELTTVLLDFVNEAKRDVLENYEWDFDIRSDGIFKTVAAATYSSVVDVDNGSTTLTLLGTNNVSLYTTGGSRSRIRVTSDTTYGDTAFILNTGSHPGSHDIYVLETGWPGTTYDLFGTTGDAEILTSEYVLPATVRDVLSVMVEENDVYVEFVDKAESLDRCLPNPFDLQSTQPEVCFVGGTTTPTVATSSTPTPGVGVWIYPVPSSVYVVRYTYRYRHPELTAITSTLYVPDHVADLIVDLAVARAMRTRVAPDLEASNMLEGMTMARLSRSVKRTGHQPLERMTLRSHDKRGGVPYGGSPRNPRIFYQP